MESSSQRESMDDDDSDGNNDSGMDKNIQIQGTQDHEKKKLSFSPRVQTYDIPSPSIMLVHDEPPDAPSFESDSGSPAPPRRESYTPSVSSQRSTGTRVSRSRWGGNPVSSNGKPNGPHTPHNTPKSQSPQPKSPDWYEELTESQINMFKDVFELLDRDGGGTINSDELYNSLKDLDIDIRREEIDQVLYELDRDGNGEIDFDEFLFAMSMMERPCPEMEVNPDAYSRRQRLFFTAITRFAIKNSLSEIERYYATKARQAPHVISFYTAGARLIGLNDRQLEQELKRLQKAAKNQDSPYAKLPFMTTRRNKNLKKMKAKKSNDDSVSTPRQLDQQRKSAPATSSKSASAVEKLEDDEDTFSSEESEQRMSIYRQRRDHRRHNIMPDSSDLDEITFCYDPEEMLFPEEYYITLLNELAKNGSIVARLPGIHLIPAIRTKLEVGDKVLCSSNRKRKSLKTVDTAAPSLGSKSTKSRVSGSTKMPKPPGWTVPKMSQRHFDMPTIPMSEQKRKTLTIEDVPYIRQKVSKAMGRYYGQLQKDHVKTAWDHWDNLHIDTVQSSKLRENFRKVYCAYSPNKQDDVFVIAPWIPGPRYQSATAGRPSQPYRPTPRPHSTGVPVRSSGYGCYSRMSSRSGRTSTALA